MKGALAAMKPLTAMYVGGMGSASHNFHRDAMARRGEAGLADRIQELWLAGKKQEAIDAIPDEYLDDGALVGSLHRIRERWTAWEDRPVTGLIVRTRGTEGLDLLADLAGTRDAATAGA